MRTTEQKLSDLLKRFEQAAFYDEIREVVAESIEDIRCIDNEDIERIENELAEMDSWQIEIKAELTDLRKLIEDELGKINKGLSLILGMQDA